MKSERERLIKLLQTVPQEIDGSIGVAKIADHLISNGVIVTPCVAMVEQFIKDGKFDKKHTAHNGRFAVVYRDKTKSGYPLIDITEQFYETEKANERIKALAERSEGK